MAKKPVMQVNSNFHHIAGEDVFVRRDSRFVEYRKKWEEWPRNFYTGAFPLFIDIEVTSICNLKCPFCATTFRGKAIGRGFMDPKLYKKIIDEGADNGLYGVKLNIRGEPLLHPDIYEFVKYAKSKGLVDVYFNTNALALTEDMSKKMIDACLDRISISFEGYTKDVYEKHRVGSNFEKVLKNIETLQATKKELGVSHPKVRVQTVMLPDVAESFDEYKKFWEHRADEVAYLDYKEMKTKRKGIEYPWACPQIWQRMAIWWDGTMLPCNHDDDGLLALGNAADVAVKDAWGSDKLKKLRETHKMGRGNEMPACDGCYLRDSEILKLQEKGAKR